MKDRADAALPRRRCRRRPATGGAGGSSTTTAFNATLLFLLVVVVGVGVSLVALFLLSSSSSSSSSSSLSSVAATIGGGVRATTTAGASTSAAARLTSAVAAAFGGVGGRAGGAGAGALAAAATTATTTAFFPGELSADLAWEKSEDAFRTLGHHPEEEEAPAAAGREEVVGGGGNGDWHRPLLENLGRVFRPRWGRNDDDDARVVAGGLPSAPSSPSSSRNRRRNRAVRGGGVDGGDLPAVADIGASSPPRPLLLGLPPSAAFSCVAAIILLWSLAASSLSFVARSRGRRRRGAVVAMDKDEAEIAEFYEREEMMECGTSPDMGSAGEEDDDDEDEEWRRLLGGTECQVDGGGGSLCDDPSGPSSAGPPRENTHRRSASDPSLVGHPRHHTAGEGPRRHSGCDLYYSRVLGQLLDYEDEDFGEDGARPLADEREMNEEEEEGGIHRDAPYDEDGDSPHHDDRDCQIAVLENLSSLTYEEDYGGAGGAVELEQDRADPTAAAEDTPPGPQQSAVSACCALFEGTLTAGEGQEQELGRENVYYRPPSPLSSSSSISSLTSEGCDIEAPSGSWHERGQENDATNLSCAATPLVVPEGEGQVSRSPSLTLAAANAEYDVVSPARSNMPARCNPHHDRSRFTALRGEKEQSPRRHVSFSPNVEVCDITPRHPASGQKRVDEVSFEVYLYVMLLAVAVAITVFSLVPAHPSLSPVHSTARGGILQLTENLLNSQWDVEL